MMSDDIRREPYKVYVFPIPLFTRVVTKEGRKGELRGSGFQEGGEAITYTVQWDDGQPFSPVNAQTVEADLRPRVGGDVADEDERNLLGKIVDYDTRLLRTELHEQLHGIGSRTLFSAQVVQIAKKMDPPGGTIKLEDNNDNIEFGLYFYENGGIFSSGHTLGELEWVRLRELRPQVQVVGF
jgi:hypothetical protein